MIAVSAVAYELLNQALRELDISTLKGVIGDNYKKVFAKDDSPSLAYSSFNSVLNLLNNQTGELENWKNEMMISASAVADSQAAVDFINRFSLHGAGLRALVDGNYDRAYAGQIAFLDRLNPIRDSKSPPRETIRQFLDRPNEQQLNGIFRDLEYVNTFFRLKSDDSVSPTNPNIDKSWPIKESSYARFCFERKFEKSKSIFGFDEFKPLNEWARIPLNRRLSAGGVDQCPGTIDQAWRTVRLRIVKVISQEGKPDITINRRHSSGELESYNPMIDDIKARLEPRHFQSLVKRDSVHYANQFYHRWNEVVGSSKDLDENSNLCRGFYEKLRLLEDLRSLFEFPSGESHIPGQIFDRLKKFVSFSRNHSHLGSLQTSGFESTVLEVMSQTSRCELSNDQAICDNRVLRGFNSAAIEQEIKLTHQKIYSLTFKNNKELKLCREPLGAVAQLKAVGEAHAIDFPLLLKKADEAWRLSLNSVVGYETVLNTAIPLAVVPFGSLAQP